MEISLLISVIKPVKQIKDFHVIIYILWESIEIFKSFKYYRIPINCKEKVSKAIFPGYWPQIFLGGATTSFRLQFANPIKRNPIFLRRGNKCSSYYAHVYEFSKKLGKEWDRKCSGEVCYRKLRRLAHFQWCNLVIQNSYD